MDRGILFKNFEPVATGCDIQEPLSNMVEAAADRGSLSRGIGFDPSSRIDNFEPEDAAQQGGLDLNPERSGACFKAEADRIFRQRMEEKTWEWTVLSSAVDIECRHELLLVSPLLYGQIATDGIQLALQRDLRMIPADERIAQEFGEIGRIDERSVFPPKKASSLHHDLEPAVLAALQDRLEDLGLEHGLVGGPLEGLFDIAGRAVAVALGHSWGARFDDRSASSINVRNEAESVRLSFLWFRRSDPKSGYRLGTRFRRRIFSKKVQRKNLKLSHPKGRFCGRAKSVRISSNAHRHQLSGGSFLFGLTFRQQRLPSADVPLLVGLVFPDYEPGFGVPRH